jgi:hypothetical protein
LTFALSGAKRKPALDQDSFQQLLAAAYVLQQHNDSLRAKNPGLDPGSVLSQVTETQSLIRDGALDLVAAASLIADRLRNFTVADSISICLIDGGYLECIAYSGAIAKVPGGAVAAHSLVATERLRNGRQFQSTDAQRDVRLDLSLCRELQIGSLLAVPIERAHEVAGVIELRWSKPGALQECDERTCQLMGNLLAEALERDVESVSTETFPGEPERIKRSSRDFPDQRFEDPTHENPAGAHASELPSESLASKCRVCGHVFAQEDAFCGKCGMLRMASIPSAEGLQSKWASMWFMQKAQRAQGEQRSEHVSGSHAKESAAESWAGLNAPILPTAEVKPTIANSDETKPALVGPEGNSSGILSRLKVHRNSPMIGALAAVSVLALVLWVIWPAQSPSHLSWFESVLVQLGLAQVPAQTPNYPGNSNVRVWTDVHTGLYYCPGSSLYGKTPGGRFTSQRTAQQDHFEPAASVACE